MRILVTGAGGMLGHDVLAAARAAGHDPAGLSRAELDVTDAAAVRAALAAAAPDAVINCAAYTRVDAAEDDVAAALAVNGAAAGLVADACTAVGAFCVHVSTDYVFDGDKRSPYLESDPVGPVSSYGRSKLDGEQAVARAAPDAHAIVRTAWLFGAHGPCFPATMLRLAADRDELRVVADQIGCPTYTPHLAEALVAIAVERRSGILHVAAAGETSWAGFAAAVLDAAGATSCTVTPIPSAEYPTPAPRPAYSVLRSERDAPTLPDWREGLESYLSERSRVAA